MDKFIETGTPVFAPKSDTQTLKRLGEMLQNAHPKLVGMDGEEIFLPDSIYQVLRQVVEMMASEQIIFLVPHGHYLSTQEAADLLNVSRSYLYTLLENQEIPFEIISTHRRIKFEDLMEYKQKRDKKRRQTLTELTAFSQELGFYDIGK